MTINFYLNYDPKSKDPDKVIFAYVRDKGNTIVLHTGERINPKFWNADKQEAKKGYIGSPELNTYLASYKEEIKKTIRILLTENFNLEFEDIKKALLKKFRKDENRTGFFDVFGLFLELRKTELSTAMINKYRVLRNHLLSFETETNFKITFNSIDMMFYDRFSNFLINEKEHTNNTVSKYFDNLKTFLHWATDRKVNTNLDFMKFKAKNDKTDIVYLTDNELTKLYELDLKDRPALEKARDVFCFSCFTGQRFSDVSELKRDDIKEKYWNLRVTKTRDILKIPLSNNAIEILSRYADQEKPLPIISSQKTNQHLKELCKIAGINDNIAIVQYRGSEQIEEVFLKYELISTHTARRTFVTLSLEKGMRPETVMEITGHKDYKTFKKYIKITSTVKTFEMNKIWNKISD